MRLKLFALISVIFFSMATWAGDHEAYLRRTSFLIRGIPPSAIDLKKISETSEAKYPEVLGQLIDSYMQSPLFAEKMRLRVGELFKFRSIPNSMRYLLWADEFTKDSMNDAAFPRTSEGAFDLLVGRVAAQNLSWNELLVPKSYPLVLKDRFSKRELDFYENVFRVDDLYKTSGSVELGKDRVTHPESLGGLLTTSRFFERYFTASENRNRDRAQAIFEIFLCQNLETPASNDQFDQSVKKRQTYETFNQAPDAQTDSQVESAPQNSSLDQLASVYDFSALRPSATKSGGRLSYGRTNSPFAGMAELAKILIASPDFRSCQADHFWNWFIGDDIPSVKDLPEAFDRVDRRPKDFIKHIFLQMAQRPQPKAEAATFEPRFHRTLEFFDLFQTLQFDFGADSKALNKCRMGRNEMRNLGFIDPASGKRGSSRPNLGYYNFVYSCISSAITEKLPIFASFSDQQAWSSLTKEKQSSLVSEMAEKVIGPHVLTSEELRKFQLETIAPALAKIPDMSVRKIMVRVTILTMMSPAFLSL